MPTYEYQCTQCLHKMEAFQKMSDAPLIDCPNCHTANLTKLVSAAGFQLKGSGWYVTDYSKKKQETKPANSTASETNAEKKKADDSKSTDSSSTSSDNSGAAK